VCVQKVRIFYLKQVFFLFLRLFHVFITDISQVLGAKLVFNIENALLR